MAVSFCHTGVVLVVQSQKGLERLIVGFEGVHDAPLWDHAAGHDQWWRRLEFPSNRIRIPGGKAPVAYVGKTAGHILVRPYPFVMVLVAQHNGGVYVEFPLEPPSHTQATSQISEIVGHFSR